MLQQKIVLRNAEDIKLLCHAAVACPFDIDVLSGNYIIDAKSIMGIFSLERKDDVSLRIDADAAGADAFLHQIESLLC